METQHTSRGAVLVAATLTSFMAPFMISAVNIALPAIQAEFSISAVLLSWIATSYLLATAVFLVPIARIADIHGRKKVLLCGIFIFTVATTATAFAPSVHLILLFRVLQGIGGSMTMTTGIAIISSVFPVSERGKAIGITVAAVYIGLSAGPFVAGYLVSLFGWRSVFLVNAPIGTLAFFLALKMIRGEWADARGERLDIVGSLLYGLALIILMYGLSILPDPLGIALSCAGVIGFALFIWQETRTPFPVFEVSLFRQNRTFMFSSLAALINYAATFAVAFFLSLYLQYIKGMTPQGAGLILVCQPVMQALFSPLAGRLSDRIEPALIASVGMGMTALGLILLIFIHAGTTNISIIGILLLLGIGFALFSSPNMNAIMSSVAPKYYGLASGTVATMRLLGQMFSMAVATVIFSILIGDAPITPSTYDLFLKSLNLAFKVFSTLCVIGIYFSSARGTMWKQTDGDRRPSDVTVQK
ncbi:MFS transporter [Desulfonema ishimotonii]|uniref:MFS transporter n=1 Tax=Desulfonema ishimotonii TaxID=45657 RepID=A0A401FR11_9BACT|nr:MFS transporter [Desulfonema ishimotonii]GBC59394.1 MFS transporter [Desulfonema ishimotonii]